MELDEMKKVWKNAQAQSDVEFQKEKVMKHLRMKLHQFNLHDGSLPLFKGLAMALAILFLATLGGIVIKWENSHQFLYPLLWLFGMGSVISYFQYKKFQLATLENQPLYLYVQNALKRIKAQKISRIFFAIAFTPFYLYIFFSDAEFHELTWEGAVAGIMMLAFFGLVFGALYWFRRTYNTGSIRDLEKELKDLQRELQQAQEAEG
jgi:hypothetical protein